MKMSIKDVICRLSFQEFQSGFNKMGTLIGSEVALPVLPLAITCSAREMTEFHKLAFNIHLLEFISALDTLE